MNSMEIGTRPEIKQNEEMEEQIHLPDTIDRWKKLVEEQAKALEIVTVEKDDLQIRCQDMEEFLLKLQEKMYSQRIEKQKLFFENHELQGEIQKLNGEIQQLTAELSKIQKLNQSLQQSNDDLRNRNGLQSRREQERIEEEIKNVRGQNAKLELLVNASSVEAVSAAQKKQKEAEKKIRITESRMKIELEKAKAEIKRLKKELEKRNEKMKEKEVLWMVGCMILVLIVMMFHIVF